MTRRPWRSTTQWAIWLPQEQRETRLNRSSHAGRALPGRASPSHASINRASTNRAARRAMRVRHARRSASREPSGASGRDSAAGPPVEAMRGRRARTSLRASPSESVRAQLRHQGEVGLRGKASFSKDKPTRKPFAKKSSAEKPFAGRPREGGESGKRVYRKFDAPRDRAARPFSSDRPARSTSADRPARPARAEGAGGAASKATGEFAPRKFAGKPFGKPVDSREEAFGKSAGKPGGFAGKKPFGKSAGKPGASFAGKPASTFAKFAGNKKPFGKRAPARKFKPKEDGPTDARPTRAHGRSHAHASRGAQRPAPAGDAIDGPAALERARWRRTWRGASASSTSRPERCTARWR